MPPLNPLLGCLQQHPFTHSHGRCNGAAGVTVARSYAETKIESYEQRDGHARWAAPRPNSAGFITRESRTSEQRKQNPYDIPLYGLVFPDPYWPIVTQDDINAMFFKAFLRKNIYIYIYTIYCIIFNLVEYIM